VITREVALARVRQALRDQHLDTLVAASPWNVHYTAGTSFLTQRTIPERVLAGYLIRPVPLAI
jgi:hypothetical protein